MALAVALWIALVIVVFFFVVGFRWCGPPTPYYWRRRQEHGTDATVRWGWWADLAWLAFFALVALVIVAYVVR
jgi:hypothetical protein